jgi:hypothetical protein
MINPTCNRDRQNLHLAYPRTCEECRLGPCKKYVSEPRIKLHAQVVPWSSVVGTGVMLMDERGRCIGQLGLHGVQLPGDLKENSLKLVQQIAEAINAA